MAAEIFGSRFLDRKGPAWHGLGIHGVDTGAVEGLSLIGEYQVDLYPLYARLKDGRLIQIREQAIIRDPTPDDQNYQTFGIAGADYQLVTPSAFAKIYDKIIKKPVETIGSLKQGSTIFISTALPTFDVEGDEIKDYLLLTSPMDGGHAVTIRNTPVRVVCQNTLMLAASAAVETFVIRHNTEVMANLENWMKDMWGRAEKKANLIQKAFQNLAHYKVRTADVYEVLDYAYPRIETSETAPESVLAERRAKAESRNQQIVARKEACISLFEGGGTGMDRPSCRGTAFGLVNAICEVEQYRRGLKDEAMDREVVFGKRGQVMARGYEATYRIVSRS